MSKPHSPTASPPIAPSNRRTHRKRVSALRLSSDTTSTLPEYIATGGWSQTTTTTTTTTTTSGTGRPGIEAAVPAQYGLHQGVDTPLDLPPDYPDSAEEADEDTDSESAVEGGHLNRHRQLRQQQSQEYVPQFTAYGGHHHHNHTGGSSGTTSPRRVRRFPSHKSSRSVGTSSTGPKTPLPPSIHHSARSSPVPSPTASDLFLDSLLERSVHALEMSNALLQSSMTTRSSISTLISAGGDSESGSPPKAAAKAIRHRGSRSNSAIVSDERYDALESRIKTWKNVRETWADDLDEIKMGVERLFGGGEGGESVDDTEVEVGRNSQSSLRREYGRHQTHRSEGSISSSLPAESPLKQRAFSSGHRHQRSISSAFSDSQTTNPPRTGDEDDSMPQLRFEALGRERLVAHPPRALTQYVVANADADTIFLPSTLGVRSTSSSHKVVPVDKPEIAAKGAYTMLSSLVSRSPSTSSNPSSTLPSPKIGNVKPRRSSSSSSNTLKTEPPSSRRRKSISPSRSGPSVGFMGRSRSETPRPSVGGSNSFSSPSRRMTPPIEGLSSSSHSSSTSCSSDEETVGPDGQRRRRGPCAKRTVLELRRILDEQPAPQPPQPEANFEIILRPPALLKKVGGTGTTVEAGTSNATASVSRLLTKNKHSSSTRPPSPPRQSALKGRSIPGTPTTPMEPPTSVAIEAAVQAAQVTAAAATTSPKSDLASGAGSAFRIPTIITSFARNALGNGKGKGKGKEVATTVRGPIASSQPGSGASTPKRISFAELPESHRSGNSRLRSRKSKSGHGRKRSLSDSDERDDDGWLGWLMGGTASTLRHDRMEDRFDRPWSNGPGRMMGGGGYSSGIDEWAV
ncbi:hypothetical protein V5O48_005802 [Marasmius crinis-equi]|uniref:Uncharacterized protein n=1 Tax=Marasmius crinis-equi TaxID=585013 RepID=A0ABR3FLC3_9AGAR